MDSQDPAAPESLYTPLPKRFRTATTTLSSPNAPKPEAQSAAEDLVRHAVAHQSALSSQPTQGLVRAISAVETILPLDNMPEQFRHKGQSKAHVYQEKKQRKQRKYLSSRERRSLGLMTLPTNSVTFEAMKPLNHLWNQYMEDLKTGGAADQFSAKLVKADFHGAIMTVTQALCPTLIGIAGIVVQETAKTFKIVTRKNVVKSIGKQGAVFSVTIARTLYHLYGSQLQYRSSERAARKFKGRPTIDL